MRGAQRQGAPVALQAPPDSNGWRVEASRPHTGSRHVIARNTFTQELRDWNIAHDGAIHASNQMMPGPAPGNNTSLVGTGDLAATVGPSSYAKNGPELLWYNSATGNTTVWYLNSSLDRIGHPVLTNPATQGDGWRPVVFADFGPGPDGVTGIADILWQHTTGRVVLWYMDAGANRTLSKNLVSAGDWSVVGPR